MNSPGHRANIFGGGTDQGYVAVGAFVDKTGYVYATQQFVWVD